jgi:hypothetical protein
MHVRTLVLGIAVVVPALAHAEDDGASPRIGHAIDSIPLGIELGIAAGYDRGAGPIGDAMHFEDVAGAGAAFEFSPGYRIRPELAVGAYLAGAQYGAASVRNGNNAFSVSVGIRAAYHFRPAETADPWVSLGAGWRSMWLSSYQGDGPRLRGFDLAHLQVGLDYRVNQGFSIAPVIGVNLLWFISEATPMTNGYATMPDQSLSVTAFAGFAGHFALGGE